MIALLQKLKFHIRAGDLMQQLRADSPIDNSIGLSMNNRDRELLIQAPLIGQEIILHQRIINIARPNRHGPAQPPSELDLHHPLFLELPLHNLTNITLIYKPMLSINRRAQQQHPSYPTMK
jgi:hypothetical protein